jgi:hypothetical protein
MGTFTLEDLTAYEKSFKPSVAAPVVAAETPPVVPETPVEPETPPAEGDVVVAADSTPPVADEPAPEAPPKGSARERIEELVAERNALKKYLEYRDSLEQRPPAPAPAVAAPATEAAPTLESCQFDTDKWTKEMNSWTQKQIQAGIKQALTTEKQTATVETQKAKFEERMESFGKSTPDLKVVLGNPSLPRLAPEAASLVVASDLGPQILYHLGKNPEKAARIARQSPIEQAAAVGRLEAELKVAPKPQKQLSNAPSPPTPTRGAGGAPISTADPRMGLKEFMEREKQALIDRRRRH